MSIMKRLSIITLIFIVSVVKITSQVASHEATTEKNALGYTMNAISGSVIKEFSPSITESRDGRENLLNGEYSKAVECYKKSIMFAQQRRTTGNGVNGDMIGEYALALALDGKCEMALVYLDRARALFAKYSNFYTSAILQICGYNKLSAMFSYDEMPSWIANDYLMLVAGKTLSPHNALSPGDLQRAVDMEHSGQDIQALIVLSSLASRYPDAQIVQTIYSNVCEKLGLIQEAANALALVIKQLKEDDPAREKYVTHYNDLIESAMSDKKRNGATLSANRLIVYVGGSIAKKTYSISSRFGIYTAKNFSATLNVGGNYSSDTFFGSLGLSAYYQWRCLVIGQGFTYTFGGEKSALNYSPSIGVSIIPRGNLNTSYDLTIGANIPFSQDGGKTSFYFSLGRTFYFDLNNRK